MTLRERMEDVRRELADAADAAHAVAQQAAGIGLVATEFAQEGRAGALAGAALRISGALAADAPVAPATAWDVWQALLAAAHEAGVPPDYVLWGYRGLAEVSFYGPRYSMATLLVDRESEMPRLRLRIRADGRDRYVRLPHDAGLERIAAHAVRAALRCVGKAP